MHRTAWFASALLDRPCVYHREFLSELGQLEHNIQSRRSQEPNEGTFDRPDWCIFTFYDLPSSKQLALLALAQDFKYMPTNIETNSHTCWKKYTIPSSTTLLYCMSLFSQSDPLAMSVSFCFVLFCFRLQTQQQQQAPIEAMCGGKTGLSLWRLHAWSGREHCWLQRSQSKHTNSSWPSHAPCWWMHLNSQSGIPLRPPPLPPHLNRKMYLDPVMQAADCYF